MIGKQKNKKVYVKKVCNLIALFFGIVSLSGCTYFRVKLGDHQVYVDKKYDQIISVLDNKDCDQLYNLFSLKTQNSISTLKEDVEEVMSFYSGTFVQNIEGASNGCVSDTVANHNPTITRFELGATYSFSTTTDKFTIHFSWFEIDEDKEDVGLQKFYIEKYIDSSSIGRIEPKTGITINRN